MGKSLIIGSTVCDVMIYLDKLPQREGDVHVSKQQLALGGCAFNVAQVLHELGADYDFISPVGTGIYGDFVAAELAKRGLTPSHRVPEENGCCYCFVEADGERTFVSYHGAEYLIHQDWLTALADQTYDYIYVCGLELEEETGAELLEGLSHLTGQLVFAPGPRGVLLEPDLLEQVYGLQPILHLNAQEACQLTGQDDLSLAVQTLYARTQSPLIVTRGAEGAVVYDGDWHDVPGQPATVRDTIGAGDSHVGALMTALASGQSLLEATAFANRLAAEVVGVAGSRLPAETYRQFSSLLGQ